MSRNAVQSDFSKGAAAMLALLVPLSSIACAHPARPDAMVPPGIEARGEHLYSANIWTRGGKETRTSSQISNEAFTRALTVAIVKSGLFYPVFDKSGDYLLEVTIVNVDQPVAGLSMSVKMVTNWKLARGDITKIVWQDVISTTYEVPFSEAPLGMERLRLANEGAARANIEEGIRRLSLLDL